LTVNRLNIVKSSTWTPTERVSSGLNPVTTMTGLSAAAEEPVTTMTTTPTAAVCLDRVAQPCSRGTRARHFLWVRVQPALSVGGMVATRGPAREPLAFAADSGAVGDARMGAHAGGTANNADTEPQAAPPKPPSAISRVELTIDSLRNYELIRPIPVVVESLGERNYVAEMPDFNISTSASNQSDILITLKDRIAQVYDGLRIKKNLDSEQTRQLKLLETYIGKARRSWLDRR
jgi:hypothetical protein